MNETVCRVVYPGNGWVRDDPFTLANPSTACLNTTGCGRLFGEPTPLTLSSCLVTYLSTPVKVPLCISVSMLFP